MTFDRDTRTTYDDATSRVSTLCDQSMIDVIDVFRRVDDQRIYVCALIDDNEHMFMYVD